MGVEERALAGPGAAFNPQKLFSPQKIYEEGKARQTLSSPHRTRAEQSSRDLAEVGVKECGCQSAWSG